MKKLLTASPKQPELIGLYAQLLPEHKLDVIPHLQQQYQTVAMVGDVISVVVID